MKAKVKSTGVIFECSDYIYDNDGNEFTWGEIELINKPDYNQVRIQAAIAAMQGILSNETLSASVGKIARDDGRNNIEIMAKAAVELADALVKELKGD